MYDANRDNDQRPALAWRDRHWGLHAATGAVLALLLILGYTSVAGSGGRGGDDRPAAGLPGTVAGGVAVACVSGQQAVIRQGGPAGPVQVTCVPDATMGTVQAVPYGATTPSPYGPHIVGTPTAVPVNGWGAVTPQPLVASPAVYQAPVYEPPARRVVVQERRPVRRVTRPDGRSWQKSAVVIGSSAGIGAGVGAAIGGKKGALIGAALGGGGAAIWDQATRR